jgi:uncharacterized Zn-binding protein involved in type VI secretion
MPAAARLGDNAQVDNDAHGCPACPHPGIGPIVVGSPDVFINSLPAARQDDIGIHAVCCGPNNFTIKKGSPTIYVNNKPLARVNDNCQHCGGAGPIKVGSPDVMADDGAAPDAATLSAGQQNTLTIANQAGDSATGAQKKGTGQQGQAQQGQGGDAAQDQKKDQDKSGTILSAKWSLQRAANGQEVELQIETKGAKGSLSIEIWAQGADRTQDQKVSSDSVSAADSIKKKITLSIPQGAANQGENFFYYIVKDSTGGEKKSEPLFVDRAPFKFSV